jgi:acetolactate synthase-1/2/3 large subunit
MQLGVADATTNSTPLVAISAQVGQDREYKESHQYVDLVSMFAPIAPMVRRRSHVTRDT